MTTQEPMRLVAQRFETATIDDDEDVILTTLIYMAERMESDDLIVWFERVLKLRRYWRESYGEAWREEWLNYLLAWNAACAEMEAAGAQLGEPDPQPRPRRERPSSLDDP